MVDQKHLDIDDSLVCIDGNVHPVIYGFIESKTRSWLDFC